MCPDFWLYVQAAALFAGHGVRSTCLAGVSLLSRRQFSTMESQSLPMPREDDAPSTTSTTALPRLNPSSRVGFAALHVMLQP